MKKILLFLLFLTINAIASEESIQSPLEVSKYVSIKITENDRQLIIDQVTRALKREISAKEILQSLQAKLESPHTTILDQVWLASKIKNLNKFLELINGLDLYILLSKGEGFTIPYRPNSSNLFELIE